MQAQHRPLAARGRSTTTLQIRQGMVMISQRYTSPNNIHRWLTDMVSCCTCFSATHQSQQKGSFTVGNDRTTSVL